MSNVVENTGSFGERLTMRHPGAILCILQYCRTQYSELYVCILSVMLLRLEKQDTEKTHSTTVEMYYRSTSTGTQRYGSTDRYVLLERVPSVAQHVSHVVLRRVPACKTTVRSTNNERTKVAR